MKEIQIIICQIKCFKSETSFSFVRTSTDNRILQILLKCFLLQKANHKFIKIELPLCLYARRQKTYRINHSNNQAVHRNRGMGDRAKNIQHSTRPFFDCRICSTFLKPAWIHPNGQKFWSYSGNAKKPCFPQS